MIESPPWLSSGSVLWLFVEYWYNGKRIWQRRRSIRDERKRRLPRNQGWRLKDVQVQHQDENNRMGFVLLYRMDFVDHHHSRIHHEERLHDVRHLVLHRTDPKHHRVIRISLRSCFLATPSTQIKDMFKKTRWVLTLLYLSSTIATVVLALVLP